MHSFPIDEQVRGLVRSARLVAVGTYMPLLDRFPEIGHFSSQLNHWDFLMTVADVSCALGPLAQKLSRSEYETRLEWLQHELTDWDQQGCAALDVCLNFVTNTLKEDAEDEYALEDAVGMWFMGNMYGRAPTYEESGPARAIGLLAARFGRDYWATTEPSTVALQVNAILERYVALHDAVFRFSLRKVFRRIDFPELRDSLDSLLRELEQILSLLPPGDDPMPVGRLLPFAGLLVNGHRPAFQSYVSASRSQGRLQGRVFQLVRPAAH